MIYQYVRKGRREDNEHLVSKGYNLYQEGVLEGIKPEKLMHFITVFPHLCQIR